MSPEDHHDDLTHPFDNIEPGVSINQYTVRELIGSGGMGVVFLAHDESLDRTAALKFLGRHLCLDENCRDRFMHEARATARLNHPNIVTVYEVNEFVGRPYFAMEFVDGSSLRRYLTKRSASMEEILEIAIQVCDGLTDAHKHGIIHRDIKPSNILMSERGRAKIVDFGLASILEADGGGHRGEFLGTYGYMSPEQLDGKPVTERSDLFSLGVVLYEIITGTGPFTRDTVGQTTRATMQSDPMPMSHYTSLVPLEVERIVHKLLNRNPELRYHRAEDLRADLRYILEAVVSGRAKYRGRKDTAGRTIAILPFKNLSVEREQDYFCEGVAEEITNALTKIRGLHVAARTSAFAFKNSSENLQEIGRKLHVETLLEGSVRRSGNKLRVSVQMTDVATGYHLWSERYDRDTDDVFAIQDEISESVAKALEIILGENERHPVSKAQTSNARAFDYYLRGRRFFHQSLRKSLQFARDMFIKASEVDPEYALAYVGIADCHAMLIHLYGESRDVNLAEAERASRRALDLDPRLPQAHSARGFTLWLMDDFEQAKVEFETAMEMDSGLSDTRYLYGRACFQRGDFERAAQLFEDACRAQEHHEARFFAAQAYTAMGGTEKALIAYRLALRAIEKHIELNPDDARAHTMAAVALCRLGERNTGIKWAERALTIDPDDAGIQYNVACLFALENETDRAIDCLEAAVRAGFAHRDWVERDPDLDSLRNNPRFKALTWRE